MKECRLQVILMVSLLRDSLQQVTVFILVSLNADQILAEVKEQDKNV